MARFEDLLGRWLSWGGVVVAVACASAIAALNWYSIARSFAYGGADAATAGAVIAAQRYAFAAVMLLVVGLRLVDRRAARIPWRPVRAGNPGSSVA